MYGILSLLPHPVVVSGVTDCLAFIVLDTDSIPLHSLTFHHTCQSFIRLILHMWHGSGVAHVGLLRTRHEFRRNRLQDIAAVLVGAARFPGKSKT